MLKPPTSPSAFTPTTTSSSRASSCPPARWCRKRTCAPRCASRRAQDRRARRAQRQAGASLQPDHRLRHAGHRPGDHVHVHNWRWATSSATTRSALDDEPTNLRRDARDLPGHHAPRRPGRDAQLHRHPDQRELLGDGARSRSPSTSRERLDAIPECRRRCRPHPQDAAAAWRSRRGACDLLRRTIAGYARHPTSLAC